MSLIISKKETDAINSLISFCEIEEEEHQQRLLKHKKHSKLAFYEDCFTCFHSLKHVKHPELNVESTYTGIHLNRFNYHEIDFFKLVEQFRNNQMLHIKYAVQLLKDALNILIKYPNISNCDMTKSTLPGCVIVGDLHGSFKDLYHIIQKFGIPGKYYYFVFNGDFVDRGSNQSEVILILLFAFLLYPDRVFLNRGNHECISMNLSKAYNPNFNQESKRKFGGYGKEFFYTCHTVFRNLPIATIVTNKAGFRCFVVHGGISDKIDLSLIQNDLVRSDYASVSLETSKNSLYSQLVDLLWSDPHAAEGIIENKNRGISVKFDENSSREFCLKNGFNAIVRSHEVRKEGYSKDHPFCWTVFSSSDYYGGINLASIFRLDQTEAFFHIYQFRTTKSEIDVFLKQKTSTLKILKAYLNKEYDHLMKEFKTFDPDQKGWIKVTDWAYVIANQMAKTNSFELDVKYLIDLRHYLLPCNTFLGIVYYQEMFGLLKGDSPIKIFHLLDDIFSSMDTDHDSMLDTKDVENALKIVNETLNAQYTIQILLDENKEFISYDDFITEFVDYFDLKITLFAKNLIIDKN